MRELAESDIPETTKTAMGMADRPRFTRFSDLPSEIRIQIWQNALPDEIKPTLFAYKPGCWQPWFISESDAEYDPVHFFDIHMRYNLDHLDPMTVDIPLFFVNLEARGVAQSWMREHNLKTRFLDDASQALPVRHFNPLYDALYVSIGKYQGFACELLERGFKPDLIGQTHSYGFQDIPNIAVSEELFWILSQEFGDVALDWFCPKVLFILLNAQDELHSHDDGDGKLLQWGFERYRWRAMIWRHDMQRFKWDDGEHVCDDDLYERIGTAATTDMILKLVDCGIREFEIRPVLAVKI